MKLVRNLRRPILTAIIAASATLGALGAAPARASDDSSVGGALLGLFGVDSNSSGEKIDYRERPKIVVPPNRQALPEPRAGADRPASWPVDQEGAHRHGARAANGGGANANADEPARKVLTEPPEGFRRPTKDMSTWKDPSAKPSFWSNPIDSIGKAVGLAN
ncbi:MAG TPA: hypothetical protein VIF61_01740 [Methylocystis sp.]